MTSASTFSESTQPEDDVKTHPSPPPVLPQRSFPHLDAHYLQHGSLGPAREPFVVMQPQALVQVHQHAISNMRSELGGFLLGHAYQDNGRIHLIVEAAIAARNDDHGPVHFKFTANSWSECHQRKEETYPTLSIIGWYHTHPGLGVFYSSDDVTVHTAGFSLPWHVGLVVDPVRNGASLFGWVDDELASLSGYCELSQNASDQSVINWEYVTTNVWDFDGYEMPPYEQEVPHRTQLIQSAASPFEWSLIAGSVGLLLFFFVVGWVALLNREVSQLEQVLLTHVGTDSSVVVDSCPDPNLRILSPLTLSEISQGSTLSILGSANLAGATRYEVHARQTGEETAWTRIGNVRFDQNVGRLARWNTKDVAPGEYTLRLTAVDRTNLQLPNAPKCQIQILVKP